MKQVNMLLLVINIFIYSQPKIVLSTGDWQPYSGQNLKHGGIYLHITTEAFAKAGIEVEYQFFPWNRVMYVAQEGEVDGTIFWTHSDERDNFFYFSKEALGKDIYVFFHLQGFSFDWKKAQDLEGLTIGCMENYIPTKELQKYINQGFNITLDYCVADNSGLQKLLATRHDLFLTSKDYGLYVIKNEFSREQAAQLTFHPRPWMITNYYLLISKKNEKGKKITQIFDQGIKILTKSERLAQMWDDFYNGKYDQK